jgi:hypothetical protein
MRLSSPREGHNQSDECHASQMNRKAVAVSSRSTSNDRTLTHNNQLSMDHDPITSCSPLVDAELRPMMDLFRRDFVRSWFEWGVSTTDGQSMERAVEETLLRQVIRRVEQRCREVCQLNEYLLLSGLSILIGVCRCVSWSQLRCMIVHVVVNQ